MTETAVIFKRSRATIHRWIEEGKIFREFYRIGGRLFLPESEIERALREKEEGNMVSKERP